MLCISFNLGDCHLVFINNMFKDSNTMVVGTWTNLTFFFNIKVLFIF